MTGTNKYLDGVIVIPNHKPKWIGVRNSGGFQLCRLEIFRAAPEGFRNDWWVFAGDSLIVQDMMPYTDYWTYTRKNHDSALAKDGVHHTKAGSDGINQLWAEVADKMIYSKQR